MRACARACEYITLFRGEVNMHRRPMGRQESRTVYKKGRDRVHRKNLADFDGPRGGGPRL